MASIAAFSYSSAKELYDHIDAQFRVSNTQLVDLTKTFLHEFKLGLEDYGHAMAMMYAIDPFNQASYSCRSRPTFVTGVPNGTEKGYAPPHTRRSIAA